MNDETGALVPVEERTVLFYDDEIRGVAVMATPSQRVVYVPVRQLCDFLGVDYTAQRRRIGRDPVLADVVADVVVQTAGGPQAMPSLPLDYLNGWLFGINANRVKAATRERLIRYQRECYQVLADAFVEPPLGGDLSPEAAGSIAALRQIRENALALARLAEEQIRITERLDRAAIVVGEHSRRLAALERQLRPERAISDAQATEVAQKVKTIAMHLAAAEPGKNHFQGIFSEMYRRFGVTSYRNIRQADYQRVLAFLDEWSAANR